MRIEVYLARKAVAENNEYPTFIPFVPAFWKTFWELFPQDGRDILFKRKMEERVAYRLHEQVFELLARPDNFRNLASHTRRLQAKIAGFRADPRKRRERFRAELEEAFDKPGQGDLETVAMWLDADPSRAPAWRLTYEVLEQWRANTTDDAKDGDLNDLTHVACVPFVGLATLDGRFVTYVQQASRSLRSRAPSIDYENRVFRSLADIVNRLESSA